MYTMLFSIFCILFRSALRFHSHYLYCQDGLLLLWFFLIIVTVPLLLLVNQFQYQGGRETRAEGLHMALGA